MGYSGTRAGYTMSTGDIFKRIKIDADHYRCGCYWTREPGFGDVLNLCHIHKAASEARIRRLMKWDGLKHLKKVY